MVMKIDKIIVSSNDDPLYLEFWPYVAKAWRKLLGDGPEIILGYLSEKPIEGLEEHGTVMRFNRRTDIIDKNMSKLIRSLVVKRNPDAYCLYSDIDMLPLNADYFIKNSEFVTENNIVLYSADQSGLPDKFPICYMLSKGNVMDEIINPEGLTEEALLDKWGSIREYIMDKPNFSDETFYSKFFGEWGVEGKNKDRTVKLARGWTNNMAHNRLDRFRWHMDINKLQRGEYIDAHLPRPFHDNIDAIKPLLDYLGI